MTIISSAREDAACDTLHISRARLTQIIPFFLRVGHKPIERDERVKTLQRWSRKISEQTADLPITNWRVEPMVWRAPDPAGMTRRRRARLVANLKEILPLKVAEAAFAQYADSVDIVSGPEESSRLIYEDHGTGCLELTVDFVSKDGGSLLPLLTDMEAWSNWSDAFIEVIDNRRLDIQARWPSLRDAFAAAIGPKDKLEGFDLLRPSASQRAPDDTCESYGNCLIVWHAQTPGDAARRDLELVSKAVGSHSPRAFGSAEGESINVLSDFGLSALFFHDYGIVAGSSEGASVASGPSRVLAMTRYLWMGYAALMVAGDGLQARIGAAVASKGVPWGEHSLQEQVEHLTRLTGVLSIVRYDALPENFTADEFEARIYGGGFKHWNMAVDVALLDRLIDDATRVVGGLSGLATQKTDRFLETVLAFIAGLTLVSVLQDVRDFLGKPDPVRPGEVFENNLLISVVFLVTVLGIAFRLGAFRFLHRSRR